MPATDQLDLLPAAADCAKELAQVEAEKASESVRRRAEADAEKKALLDRLAQPSGLSEPEKIKLAANVINRAVKNGLTETLVYRFPNALCTDRGRAINQQEAGWEQTLTGIPKEIYELWAKHLRPRGYRIRYQIIDFPGGMPGDIGVTLSWR